MIDLADVPVHGYIRGYCIGSTCTAVLDLHVDLVPVNVDLKPVVATAVVGTQCTHVATLDLRVYTASVAATTY